MQQFLLLFSAMTWQPLQGAFTPPGWRDWGSFFHSVWFMLSAGNTVIVPTCRTGTSGPRPPKRDGLDLNHLVKSGVVRLSKQQYDSSFHVIHATFTFSTQSERPGYCVLWEICKFNTVCMTTFRIWVNLQPSFLTSLDLTGEAGGSVPV